MTDPWMKREEKAVAVQALVAHLLREDRLDAEYLDRQLARLTKREILAAAEQTISELL